MKTFFLILFILTLFRGLPAQNVENIRAVHMGGNWGSNVNGVYLHPQEYFDFLHGVNADWVGISIALHVDDSMDSTVERKYNDVSIPTFSDEALVNTITTLQQKGFKVYLTLAFEISEAENAAHPVSRWQLGDPNMPNEDSNILSEYWPWGINHPEHETFVKSFWKTYTEQACHFAEMADSLGVTLFSLGTETERLFRTRSDDYWLNDFGEYLKAMVDSVRQVYSGKLTYDMGYMALTANDFYGAGSDSLWKDMGLDVIGISAYFELTDAMPDKVIGVDSLEGRWEKIFSDYLIPLKNSNPALPVLFLEFGYVNSVEAPFIPAYNEFQPWVFKDDNGNGLDDSEETQANIYEAFFNVKERNPGIIEGAFLWGHDMCDDEEWANVWGTMHHFGVRQKLAEEVVRNYYNSITEIYSPQENIPGNFELYQNYPNPFNAGTTIRFRIRDASKVTISLYNSLGQRVSVLYSDNPGSGLHSVELNSEELSTGVYFYELKTNEKRIVRKCTILK
jgi:hypothetical protein